MHLTRAERWILSNQYRLLESLQPENAVQHRKVREALESGDAALIASYAAFVRFEHPPLSDQDQTLVSTILSLYQALQQSFEQLEDKTGLDSESLQFPGFGPETESGFADHARLLIESEKQFVDLNRKHDFFSSGPSLPMYMRMLEAWRLYSNATSLSKIQILYIIEAGSEPTHD